jgi:hypothetical protein
MMETRAHVLRGGVAGRARSVKAGLVVQFLDKHLAEEIG